MPHDPAELALFVVVILMLAGAVVILVCACICGARDDQLARAWREERECATAALDDPESGLVLDFTPVYRNGWKY